MALLASLTAATDLDAASFYTEQSSTAKQAAIALFDARYSRYLGEVADEAARIALTQAVTGHFIYQTDTSSFWVLTGASYATAGHWTEQGGGSVDLTAPGPIGGTTPNTADFTDLSADTFALAGQSLTGSDATNLLDLAATWNTTGSPTGLKLNITNTASGASALLMDLQVGGTTQFSVDPSGRIAAPRIRLNGTSGAGIACDVNGNRAMLYSQNAEILYLDGTNATFLSTGQLAWSATTASSGGRDTGLARASAGVLEVTDGTGGAGSLQLASLTATGQSLTGSEADSLLDLATTWNTTGSPTGLKLNITNTASGGSALLMDLQVGGTSRFSVNTAGVVTASSSISGTQISGSTAVNAATTVALHHTGWSFAQGLAMRSGCEIMWTDSTSIFGTIDLSLERASANNLKVTDGSTGYGDIDAGAYNVNGNAGATGGTFTTITSITVENGIVTAISGS